MTRVVDIAKELAALKDHFEAELANTNKRVTHEIKEEMIRLREVSASNLSRTLRSLNNLLVL